MVMPNVLRKRNVAILVIWMIVQSMLLLKNGIVATGEAAKYIRDADFLLLTGRGFSPNFWVYATQSFLIAADKIFNAEFVFVVCIQMLFNLWATFSFYRLAAHIFSKPVGFFATIAFLMNYPFQEFNTFLQTESLYNSLTIIFSSYLLRLTSPRLNNILVIVACLFVLTITCPTGYCFQCQ